MNYSLLCDFLFGAYYITYMPTMLGKIVSDITNNENGGTLCPCIPNALVYPTPLHSM